MPTIRAFYGILVLMFYRDNRQQVSVTMNERSSLYSLIAHVPSKCSAVVATAVASLAGPFVSSFHTLTTDNGKAFAEHEAIAKALDLDY